MSTVATTASSAEMHSKFCTGEITTVAYETWVRDNLLPPPPEPPVRCDWCLGAIGPEDDVTVLDEIHFHARCKFQADDEAELREFLARIAGDCAEQVRSYREQHPSRVREHHARALLARIAKVIEVARG